MIDSASFLELLRKVWNNGDIEMNVRSYSGRGMYGKTCIAVVTNDLWDLAIELAQVAERDNLGLLDLPGSPAQDSMGLGRVYYWPQLEWPEGEEEFGDN